MIKRLALSFSLVAVLGVSAILVAPVNQANAQAPVLKKGDRQGSVWGLQNRLLQLGLYKGKVDGKFGPLTQQAVVNYQKQNGLSVDGTVGQGTLHSLRNHTFTSNQIQLLAQLVYAEAKGESLKGQVAVAAVALNRIDSGKFPNTIEGVIYEPLAFTCVQQGTFYEQPDAQAYKAVYLATQGWDPTNGSLYYFNPAKVSSSWIWSRPQTVQIGHHIFAK
jgi:N-acetylmuramoyl-L-alanine amidase